MKHMKFKRIIATVAATLFTVTLAVAATAAPAEAKKTTSWE